MSDYLLLPGILAAVAAALWAGYERGRRIGQRDEKRLVVRTVRAAAAELRANQMDPDRQVRADTLNDLATVWAE